MNARQDGRQGHWYDPTALAEPENFPEPKPTCVKNSTGATVSNTAASRKPRVSSSFYRGLALALAFDLFLIAFVVAAAYLVGYIAAHVPTAVVILGGLVLVGLVVARGTR